MAKIKTICPLCSDKSKSESIPASCPICNFNLQEQQNETLIKKTKCSLTPLGDTVVTQNSILILTNLRIFWLGDPVTTIRMTNRATPVFLRWLFPRQKQIRVSYGLDEITNIEIKKKGPLKALVMSVTGDIAVVLDVKGRYRQEWIDAVNDAKKRHGDSIL